jgi:hypothetical protein
LTIAGLSPKNRVSKCTQSIVKMKAALRMADSSMTVPDARRLATKL